VLARLRLAVKRAILNRERYNLPPHAASRSQARRASACAGAIFGPPNTFFPASRRFRKSCAAAMTLIVLSYDSFAVPPHVIRPCLPSSTARSFVFPLIISPHCFARANPGRSQGSHAAVSP
jgi:hypothetical protein